ncbi:MAG: LysR family transcriptional regulator [Polyangiaceae bacterium]|nr:LysR family transcriptional regulator [Polyangiaceae bacterium]
MEQASLPRLHYFAVVAREGSLVRAARELGTTHSNLSMQMRALEEELGGDLFESRGRRLVLTALGNEIAWYAEEVSRLARDASEVARGHERPRRTPLRVGVVGSTMRMSTGRINREAAERRTRCTGDLRHAISSRASNLAPDTSPTPHVLRPRCPSEAVRVPLSDSS